MIGWQTVGQPIRDVVKLLGRVSLGAERIRGLPRLDLARARLRLVRLYRHVPDFV